MDFALFIKVPLGSGWSPPSGAEATLNPGEAAFVLLRGNDLTNTFAGEVLQGNLTNKLVPGFNLVGNIIPDSITISPPSAGSRIAQWDVALQDYQIFPSGEWPPRMPTIAAGEGFFVRTSVPIEWVRNFSTP